MKIDELRKILLIKREALLKALEEYEEALEYDIPFEKTLNGRVYSKIVEKGTITRTDLYRKMNTSRGVLEDALASLLEQKRIVMRLPLKRGDPIIYEVVQ